MKAEANFKKQLQKYFSDSIIVTAGLISENMNFVALYKNSLVQNVFGEINDERIIIYNCGLMLDDIEKYFTELFPWLVVICTE